LEPDHLLIAEVNEMENASSDRWFNMSQHAASRVKERGIKMSALLAVLEHGDRERHVGKGRVEISLSKRQCTKLLNVGLRPSTIDKAKSICAIIAGASVITVYRAKGRER
jgi:hypothetical protein